MKLNAKTIVILAAAGGVAYWLYRTRGGSRPVCGPGTAWHVATQEELLNAHKWSAAVQDQLKRYGGYCARTGFVSEPSIEDGPILFPSQVE